MKNFFIPRSPWTTLIVAPAIWSNQKIFSLESYYLCIANIEIVQNSKSKPKKFSFLCTFKIKIINGWRTYKLLVLEKYNQPITNKKLIMHKDEKVIINITVGLSTIAVLASRSFVGVGSRSLYQTNQ